MGKPMLVIWWPDKLRSRIRIHSDEDGLRKKLMVELSIMDGTWEIVRASLTDAETPSSQVFPQSFEGVAQEYWDSYVSAHNKAPSAKKSFLKRFKSRFRNVPPKTLTKLHVDRYVAGRKNAGVSNASINRELACLKHMFSWALSRGYITRNAIADYEKLEEQEWAGPKPTEEAINAVFEKLDPRFLPIYRVIRETGARRGQVLILEHWMVDREKRIISFAKRTKKGKTIFAPLTKEAEEAIDSVPPLEGCPYVFYNPETKNRWHDARKPWEDAREAAGYPWLRVRDLRPAFATEASEYGVPTKFISSGLGHSSERVTERFYIKSVPEFAAKQLLRAIEGGRNQRELQQKSDIKTGTTGN
jgi:integrase